jgi:hypothetical protein
MSSEALPYTLLLVLVEFAIGSLWVMTASQARGNAAASFVKFGAAAAFVASGLALWLAAQMDVGGEVDGYPLEEGWAEETRWALAAVFALAGLFTVATVREQHLPGIVLGALASLAGLVAIVFIAQLVATPTWGLALVVLSLVIGSLAIGAVSMGMTLGHWYLVTPRLPEQPLREMTGSLLIIMAAQLVLLGVAVALPHDTIENSVDTPILENVFFWMRIGFGILFPALLVWMAYDSSGARAMQSATGLLYIAMALVICGEVVAKGLMLTSAVPN